MLTAARWCCVVLCCLSVAAVAQPRLAAHRSTAANGIGSTAAKDTLRLLAIMVAFKGDASPSTTGDGRFVLTPDTSAHIDPPPHDAAYFRSKIEFVQNYFRAASCGQLTVTGAVFDSVITVGGTMSAYSPSVIGNDLSPLATLASEAWQRADSLFPAIDFSRYDAFVLFHAGVGRDIDQISLAGENLTPFDIPSLTFDSAGFARAFGTSSFSGISVDSGRVHITNSIILPETESRSVGSGSAARTVELGINGLFASSIGSYLGLPDLFDTRTGLPGIGRFGLMDGAAIFAFNGIFPPLPSAWERIALGWTVPIDVATSAVDLSVPALGVVSVDTVYRVGISPKEYFLVENRSRDPHGAGQTVRFVRSSGTRDSVHVLADTDGFNLYDVSMIKGSVVDVDHFDWALSGSIDSTHQFDGGGILIWHIDEDVIQAGRADNTVNADPEHRGVALVEADASSDIGQSYGMFDAGGGTEYGSPLDCWYAGNLTPVYRNRFDGSTTPNSDSYAHARSLVAIRDFSPRLPRMRMTVEMGDALLSPLPGFPKSVPGIVDGPVPFDADGNGTTEFFAVRSRPGGRAEVMAWNEDGTAYLPAGDSSGRAARMDSATASAELVLVRSAARARSYCATVSDGIYLWSVRDGNADGSFDLVSKHAESQVGKAAVLFVDTVLVGVTKDSISIISLDGQILHSARGGYWSPPSRPARIGTSSVIACASADTLSWIDISTGTVLDRKVLPHAVTGLASGAILNSDSIQVLAQFSQGYALLTASGTVIAGSDRPGNDGNEGSVPILADLDNDGAKEIIGVDSVGTVTAFRWNGVVAEGFPLRLRSRVASGIRGIVSVDPDGTGLPNLIAVNDDGLIEWWKNLGRQGTVTRFAGLSGGRTYLALYRHGSGVGATIGLAASDELGTVRAYDLKIPYVDARLTWPMFGFDAQRSGATVRTTASPTQSSGALLPRDRAYNWPNPVYGATTQIRFFVTSDATVTVRILDLAGHVVTTLKAHAAGGTDTEIPWNVSGVESGIYFAQIEATSGSRTEQRVVRVAVVR